jgi:hypothetical protein
MQYWTPVLDGIHAGGLQDCQDYRWMYTCWSQSGLTIHPARNLVANIGFGAEASHTFGESPLAARPTEPLVVDRHPPFVLPLRQVNEAIFERRFPGAAMKRSKTLYFRATQPIRQARHWWRTRS